MATLLKKRDGRQILHDLPAYLLSKWLRRAKIPHMGGVCGFKRTCMGLFTGLINQFPELDLKNPAHAAALRHRKGVVPDLMVYATSIDLPEIPAESLGDRPI